jgi:tRNA(Ile)-lysidine synthase TilS/MesJ
MSIQSQFPSILKHLSLDPTQKIAVGLSGNQDSYLLLSLLRSHIRPELIQAFTINYSQQTQAFTEKLHRNIKQLGIQHHILNVDPTLPASGLIGDTKNPPIPTALSQKQVVNAMRSTRLKMLVDQCQALNIPTLALGHTLYHQLLFTTRAISNFGSPLQLAGLPMSETMSLGDSHVQLIRPLLPFSNVSV